MGPKLGEGLHEDDPVPVDKIADIMFEIAGISTKVKQKYFVR